MAKIIKTITGLKPDQDYLIALKVKNTEISAIDDPYESIRIHTPKDQTVPGAIDINTFYIYGNYKSVMFQFEPTVELDVNGYKYELYSDALGANLISSGTATATVFSIDVPDNSNAADATVAQTDVVYYGRIKTVDTSGNESGWTPSSGLKASTATDMIPGSHIANLTAAKITAGTIGAHEIILKQQGAQSNIVAPANMAIIRSSNYNGAYNNNTGVWTSGTTGWVISGDGRAEFSTAAIRGTLTAGSVFINANNRWKSDATGNTISTPEFKVGTADAYMYYNGVSELEVKGKITATTGKIGGLTIFSDGTLESTYGPGVSYFGYLFQIGQNKSGLVSIGNNQYSYLTYDQIVVASNGSGTEIFSDGINFAGASFGPGPYGSKMSLDWDGTDVTYSATNPVLGSGYGYLTYNFLSDRRIKRNIEEPENEWVDKILNDIKIWEFNMLNVGTRDEESMSEFRQIGVIADEFKELFPQLETSHKLKDPDGADADQLRSVNYAGLVPALVLTVQKLNEKIEALEERLAALE